ncbi:efflux RND transporter permease subunit [Polaromonas sp. 17-63-33]|uniref:efflux RND transporter permease subunit n=1 Tax=Polaromonas sp. 17-63-33 TaxID=1970413 RepID=UPI000BCA7AB5|nr:efflux RND transporter permease subunit [Polaromonas sp. 17-63-33]OZA47788.1 MAG: hypothetical protein B7X88_20580 [Polaromonas sp. 17-63-33]
MLSRLVQFSLAQRLFVLMATLMVAGAGWYALRGLPIDAFPDVSSTQVKIIMKAPGMTPEEVESRIAVPIEVEMLGIPKTKILRSVTKYGLVDITIDFEDGTDRYWARQQVSERLGGLTENLPPGISGGMAPVTTPLGEMYMFTVEGETLSLAERRSVLDWVIRPALRTVPGVADVNALGGVVRKEAIGANNRNDGAGRLGEGDEVLLVRSEGSITSLEDLRAIVVAMKDGSPVRLGNLAEVKIGTVTRYGVVTQSGRGEAVQGLVLGLAGSNAKMVVEGVRKKLEELQPTLPAGIEIKTFYDRASLVTKAVSAVSSALIEATVLVIVLLGLFLGNIRAALTVAMVLPLAALITFILMRAFGMSANLMSLGGLAIAIGMLVDAAVVVVENIVQRLATDPTADKLPRLHTIYRAVREVAVPVTAGILIIITVFLPLLTLQGLEGKYFVPVALTIVFALAGSLVLSLTIIPVLASYLLREVKHEDPWLPRKLLKLYEPVLAWSLKRQRVVAAAAAVMLLAAGLIYTQVGKTFMPTMDEGDLIVGIEKLPSISLEQSAALDLKIHRAIMQAIPEVHGIVARAGSDEIGLDPMGLNQTDTYLLLKPQGEWRMKTKEALMDEVRKVLDPMPGIKYSFTQPIEMRVSEMIIGVRGDLAVKIFGPDLDKLNQYANQVETLLKTVSGNQDVYTVQNDGVQYLRVAVDRLIDREMGSRYSVVIANVANRDLVGFVEEARTLVNQKVSLDTGYRITWGGQFENQQRAAARLTVVVPVALGLIFVLLFSTFRSVRQALLILSIIPFALVGGIVALWVTGEYLSVPASVGFIALLGITVLNGVVLVSYFNQLQSEGMRLSEVVLQGAKRRLRPVLMTASITAFGLIPLLFATGPGSEIQRPLAIVVIGGLITATALTLMLLPILYLRFAFPKRKVSDV